MIIETHVIDISKEAIFATANGHLALSVEGIGRSWDTKISS